MDGGLPPFMKFNPIWPSTFPKVLAVMGAVVALIILLGVENPTTRRWWPRSTIAA